MTTSLEPLGNREMLLGLLEGFMHDIPGVVDILLMEGKTSSLRFDESQFKSELCKKIRSSPGQKEFCAECELIISQKAAVSRKPIYKLCKSGLSSVAYPVVIDNVCLAVILWSQFRKTADDNFGYSITQSVERTLEYEKNTLVQERQKIPIITEQEFEKARDLLVQAAKYIEYQSSQTKILQEVQTALTRRIEETNTIQKIVGSLMEVVNVEAFWPKLDKALEHISKTIEAIYGVFFVSIDSDNETFETTASAFLPRDIFINRHYGNSDPILKEISTAGKYKVIDFDPSTDNSVCKDIASYSAFDITHVALIPVNIGFNRNAVMAFFIDDSNSSKNSLTTAEELPILSQAASQIATAYLNSLHHTEQEKLIEARKRIVEQQDSWFEDVSHQLIAPLNGLQASADRLVRHYSSWDQEKIIIQLKATQGIARWAARLARNFDWQVRTGQIVKDVTGLRWIKLRPFLIGCAIDLQGLAAGNGIRIHVHESINEEWQIYVNREFFYQAVENILDNAVKYANDDTSVRIKGTAIKGKLFIDIINEGLPLTPEDLKEIFRRGHRTETAKAKVTVGTGIGLPIAREIVERHGGEILVEPSIPTDIKDIHKVKFTIALPESKFRTR